MGDSVGGSKVVSLLTSKQKQEMYVHVLSSARLIVLVFRELTLWFD